MSLSARRAWIEIGNSCTQAVPLKSSLSARRAWIEIAATLPSIAGYLVALRKESVDRNSHQYISSAFPCWSLSARRAWIEMFLSMGLDGRFKLSLSARRAWIEIVMQEIAQQRKQRSLSARRAWIEIAMTSQISVSTVSLSARRAWIEM